jgi:outer membrane protein assembly factor BamD
MGLALFATLVLVGCGKKNTAQVGADASTEPDKVLYERAMEDIKHGKSTEARFILQTLLNTYPDSEYVAKAKLAVADSYYKDGDSAGLEHAINEYKDFETFFPYLDECSYAQYRVGMAHFRQMEKPDRDETQAQLAEQEFQNYLLKWPQGQNAKEVEQRLREVQEVLAEGSYRVARFYYVKGSFRASASRLTEIVDRYPLYSRSDDALWMLGQSFEKNEGGKQYAGQYYARLVRDYPLSDHVPDAKKHLESLGVPVPQPDAVALARMQEEKQHEKERPGKVHKALGMMKSSPDVSQASHSGSPQLNPPGQEPGTETLTPRGSNSIVASGGGVTGSTTEPVRTVTPSEAGSTGSDPNASGDANAAGGNDPDAAAKAPDPVQNLPNRSDTAAKEQAAKAQAQSSSKKKKKGLRSLIPF